MVVSTRDCTQLFFSGRPAEPFQGFRVLALIRFLAIQRFQGRCGSFQAFSTTRGYVDEDLEAPLGQNMPRIPAARHGLDQTVLSERTALRREPGGHFDAAEDFAPPYISRMAPPERLQSGIGRVVGLIEVELGPLQKVAYCTSGSSQILRE